MMEQKILVYVDLEGAPLKVGQLWARNRQGRESMSFEYDRSWLDNPRQFSLDPALKLIAGPFHASPDKPLFGALDDSAPDRWGRLLMRRSERKNAESEKRTARTLKEIDFLLILSRVQTPSFMTGSTALPVLYILLALYYCLLAIYPKNAASTTTKLSILISYSANR